MAHFYGRVKGGRGDATRCGTKKSGLRLEANGWDVGALVRIDHGPSGDLVSVYATGGSNGTSDQKKLIAQYFNPKEIRLS